MSIKRKYGWTIPLAVCAFTGAELVIAQEQIEEIIVQVQRKETTLWNTPASLEVLDEQDIQELQPNSLADLVRYQPAIGFDQSNDRRGNGTFVIRGLSGNRVVMLIDGTRLPDGFGSAGVSNGRNSFEPYSMNNIQFLKGPSSALYGSDALAGVVLLNTVSPRQMLGGEDSVFELSGGYDQVNEGFRQTLSNAGSALGGAYLLQVSTRQFSETDVYGDFENFPFDGNQENVLLKWENDSDGDNQYGLLMDYWRREVDANFTSALNPAGSISDHYEQDQSFRWRIGFYQNLSDVMGIDRLDWQVDLQRGSIGEDEFEEGLNRSGATVLDIEEVDIDQDLVSASLLLGEEFSGHELIAGIDLVRKSAERVNFYRDFYPATGEVDPTRNGVVYPLKSYPSSDTDLLGIFVQDEIGLVEDRLRLTLGLRYDYFNNDPQPDAMYFNSNPTGRNVGAFSSDSVSPSLGATWEANENLILFANYVSGFRSPPVSSQYINTFIQSRGFPHEVLANPDLKSETSNGVEAGLRLRGEIGRFEISTYQTDYEDFIESTRSGTRPNPIPGWRPVTQIQYKNLREVEVSGTEIDAELFLHNWLGTDDEWLLSLSWGDIEGENRSSDEPLTSIGPRQTVLGLGYRSASADYGANLQALIVEEFTDVTPGRFAVPEYTRVDASVFYNVSDNFSLNFRIDNLFDEQYWHQFVAGSRISDNPGGAAAPGRNLSISARYRFGL